jgi:hypothetical protein
MAGALMHSERGISWNGLGPSMRVNPESTPIGTHRDTIKDSYAYPGDRFR